MLEDLESGKPMDRLVCGDVGFGKTEVALRAAFVAAMAGYQVALICPTTLLARQHYSNFVERFQGFPIEIGRLSRLVPAAEVKATKERHRAGQGRHRHRHPCAAVEIDQIQEAGPGHCRRGAAFRRRPQGEAEGAEGGRPRPHPDRDADPADAADGDVGPARTVSVIQTPPVDRLAVRTYVAPWDAVVMREALLREHYRGGQSFLVAPRIADLPDLEEWLREEVPEVKAVTAHGQMSATEVEERMSAFYDKKYDVLLSTTHRRKRARHPVGQYADRPPRRPVRPGPAVPAARPGRPVEDPRLCLSDDHARPSR